MSTSAKCHMLAQFFSAGSALLEPFCERSLSHFAEDISINHVAGLAVHNTRSGVSCAWHLCVDWTRVRLKWNCNPRHVVHRLLVSVLVLIAWDNHNLQVLGAIRVPDVVASFQVLLEWSAARSPGCSVHDHDDLVALDNACTVFFAVAINELLS